jgi:hypothetical protein
MKKERHILSNIKEKLSLNNATITKADKGNSIIIIHLEEYHCRILDFISSSNFTISKKDLTKTFQKELRNLTSDCHSVVKKQEKWKYINLNPSTPTIRGLLKIHKNNSPIRPVINWRNAPVYK